MASGERSKGTFGQSTQILKVIDDEKPGTAQLQDVVANSDLLKLLVRHGGTLKGVDRNEFERTLTPPGDYWAKLPENPFAEEYSEPAEIKPVSRGFFSANHLSFSARTFTRPLGDYWNNNYLLEFEKAKPELPEGAEGWFCWPKLALIGDRLHLADPYGLDYPQCLRYMLRTTNNYRCIDISDQASGMNADQLRLLPSVAKFYQAWEKKTPGAFMVGALQLGGLYAGCSPRNARYQMINSGQFPLDPYVALCLLLADSSMLYLDDTNIDCPGAEYARAPGRVRSDILTLENSNETPTIHLFHESVHPPKMRCASGFLPEGMKLKI